VKPSMKALDALLEGNKDQSRYLRDSSCKRKDLRSKEIESTQETGRTAKRVELAIVHCDLFVSFYFFNFFKVICSHIFMSVFLQVGMVALASIFIFFSQNSSLL
jgi:hypothetical protein